MDNAERWDPWFEPEPEAAVTDGPGGDMTRLMASMWRGLVVEAMVLGLGLLVVVVASS